MCVCACVCVCMSFNMKGQTQKKKYNNDYVYQLLFTLVSVFTGCICEKSGSFAIQNKESIDTWPPKTIHFLIITATSDRFRDVSPGSV